MVNPPPMLCQTGETWFTVLADVRLINLTLVNLTIKITRHTTGEQGCNFLTISSQTISDYLGLSWTILDYLGLSWTISDYLRLYHTMSDSLRLSYTLPGNLVLFRPISGYLWLSLAIPGYLLLSLAISDYFHQVSNIRV